MIKRSVPCGGRFFVQVGESDGKEGAFWRIRQKMTGTLEEKSMETR